MSTEPQGGRYRYVIAGLILAAHLCIGLNVFAVAPVLLVIMDDYEISRTGASLLVAVALLAAAVFGLPGGMIAMRLGLKISFTLAWVSMGLLALSALAPNYPALLGLRLVFGLGSALILTATGPLLGAWFRPREVVVMNGLNSAVLSLGIAVSVGTMVPLAEAAGGWRIALTIYGGIGVLGTLAWLMLGMAAPASDHGMRAGRDREAGRGAERISVGQIPSVLFRRPVLLLLAADAGVLVQYTALTAWLPAFFTETRGMTMSQAAFLTGSLPFVGIFGALLGGLLPLRVHAPRLFLVAPGIMVILGGLSSFLLDYTPGTYLGLFLLGLGSWLYVPTLLGMSMSLVNRDPGRVAIVWGSLITFSGLAMFAAPIIVGFIRDVSGSFLPGFLISWAAAWTLLAAGLLIPIAVPEKEDRDAAAIT